MILRRAIPVLFALLLIAPSVPLHAQRPNLQKRLILKNGDTQPSDQWQIIGDRVHYHSTDRGEWEDIPSSLIDWDATNKANAAIDDAIARKNVKPLPSSKEIEDYEAALKEEEAAQPTVAPDLRLPEAPGVYLLDTWQDKPELAEIQQNGSDLNKQVGKNILRAAINPIPSGSKQRFELKGERAAVEAHIQDPAIFINIDAPAEGDASPQRFQIVRLQPTKKDKKRIVANANISLLGKESEKADVVPSTATKLNGGNWIKVTPNQPLQPGQYALVEMLSAKQMNMYVWDFGLDPAAPENHALYSGKTTPKPTAK